LLAYACGHGSLDPSGGWQSRAYALVATLDANARLWPQTERIRAYLIDRHDGDAARLREAIESLSRYLDAPLPRLWYENLAADGRFVVAAAPATSLYHIVGAISELWTSLRPPRNGEHGSAPLPSEVALRLDR
jgi:mannose-6-phosphate isomerase